jgi:hypothetical protein
VLLFCRNREDYTIFTALCQYIFLIIYSFFVLSLLKLFVEY